MDQWLSDVHYGLVAISFVVATFGALSTFSTARWIAPEGHLRPTWLLLSALILGGCTAWSPHFLGLLAVSPDFLITFDIRLTLMALAAPVAAFIPGLYFAYRWGHVPGFIPVGAVFIGCGLAAMNYIAAAAIRVQGVVEHDEFFLFAGVAFAVVLVVPAVYMARSARPYLRYAAAPVMGMAVMGMYVISMTGFSIMPTMGEVDYFTGALTPPTMLMMAGVSVVIFSLLGLTLGLSQTDGEVSSASAPEQSDEIARAREEIRRRHDALRSGAE